MWSRVLINALSHPEQGCLQMEIDIGLDSAAACTEPGVTTLQGIIPINVMQNEQQ